MSQGFFLFKGPVNLYIQGKYYTKPGFSELGKKLRESLHFFIHPYQGEKTNSLSSSMSNAKVIVIDISKGAVSLS